MDCERVSSGHRLRGFGADFVELFSPKYSCKHFRDALIIFPKPAGENVASRLFSKKSHDGKKHSSNFWEASNVGSSADLLKKTCMRLTTLDKKSSNCFSVEGVTLRARLDVT
jgi:hypothetical protein